ncbi:MAG: hypothetical protein K2X87_11870 [Gemmataceae bacterium]|nr:hypothetical protein [Gemmataceae bacterium]
MGRRKAGGLALGLAAALAAGLASAQDPAALAPHYQPNQSVGIPVNLDRINQLDNKPKELQLYTSAGRRAWQAGRKLPIDKLDDLGDGKKGFVFRADRDGPYEFSVQFHFADGSASPADPKELRPMLDVVVDTTPPEVRIRAVGNGVEWAAADDNLDPRFAEVQAKFPDWAEWKTVTDRAFQAADRHAWKLRPGQVLEVRVKARDRAGNDGWSRVVRVPGDGGVETSFPRPGGSDWLPPVGGAARDPLAASGSTAPQPRIEYVNKKDVTVDYTINKVGRSGVRLVRLYVQSDRDGDWKLVDPDFKVDLPGGKTDQALSLPYTVPADGWYGFYVAPESVSGQKAPPPRKGDPPMLYVVVDTQPPAVKVSRVAVYPGPDRKPQVDISWEAADPNLLPNPVSLEYSIDPTAEAGWKEIKYRLENNAGKAAGRYVWEVPDELPYKFFVRVRAVDKAGNTGAHVWSDKGPGGEPTPVIVDLETPAATISGVRGGAAPAKPADLPRP